MECRTEQGCSIGYRLPSKLYKPYMPFGGTSNIARVCGSRKQRLKLLLTLILVDGQQAAAEDDHAVCISL